VAKVVGGLSDDDHVDEVVEELEEADGTVLDDLPMRAGRPPEPGTEASDASFVVPLLRLRHVRALVRR
jgi:hypothetical protein